jgi:hypothetical protein
MRPLDRHVVRNCLSLLETLQALRDVAVGGRQLGGLESRAMAMS